MIDDEGQQIGILTPYDALKLAREKNLDLVEISPTAVPPVCRIMDYGKFLYQQEATCCRPPGGPWRTRAVHDGGALVVLGLGPIGDMATRITALRPG